MDSLLLDAPVGGWSGGWGTLEDVVIASPQQPQEPAQQPAQPEDGDEVAASPQAATHLLKLSEDFVAGSSPQVSPAPQALKAARKAKRAKLKPLADASPAQLNRRLKLGTVSRDELERERTGCNHGEDPEAEPVEQQVAAEQEQDQDQQEQEQATEQNNTEAEEENTAAEQSHQDEQQEEADRQQRTVSPPSSYVAEYSQAVDQKSQSSTRPGSAGNIVEFSIPIDSTPWALNSAELSDENATTSAAERERPSAGQGRSRGRAAPRTPSTSSVPPQFALDGCTPPPAVSPSFMASPDSATEENSAHKSQRRAASASRTSNLSRQSTRRSTLQSPAALASAAVDSALGRLEVDRPHSREAVAVAREVRSEMSRWLRNVDPKVPQQQRRARATVRGPAMVCRLEPLECDALPPPPQQQQVKGWVPYEQRTEVAGADRQRSLTPSSYPSLSAARARQREASAFGTDTAATLNRRSTRSAQSEFRHSVSLPDLGSSNNKRGGRGAGGAISNAAAEFQRKSSRAMAVHDRKPWGQAQQTKPKKAMPGRPRRVAAPWAGLSAVPTVGAVMSSMR